MNSLHAACGTRKMVKVRFNLSVDSWKIWVNRGIAGKYIVAGNGLFERRYTRVVDVKETKISIPCKASQGYNSNDKPGLFIRVD